MYLQQKLTCRKDRWHDTWCLNRTTDLTTTGKTTGKEQSIKEIVKLENWGEFKVEKVTTSFSQSTALLHNKGKLGV